MRRRRRPLRVVAVFGAVGALIAAVALPAYGALRPAEQAQARTIQQVAQGDAQTMVVASDATAEPLARGGYAATSADEIAKKKAEAAAAESAPRAAAATVTYSSIDLNMHAPGTGAIRWPLAHVAHVGDGFHARGGEHQGVDLLDPARTPIFSAAAGTVIVSQEVYGGYGVAVVVRSVINGQQVTTVYGHMTYGSRVVAVGQQVEAGQLLGLVGMTGRATANHLHFEVHLNGVAVDPLAWLLTNVGPVP